MPARTDTELKFEEALIQFRLACANPIHEPTFRSCVNGMIALARSVTLVMQAESGAVPGLLPWYRDASSSLQADPLCRFFNELRVHSLHRGTIRPAPSRVPVFAAHAQPGGPGTHPPRRYRVATRSEQITRMKGDVVVATGGSDLVFWSFQGVERYLPGDSGGVFRLSRKYLETLRAFVQAWLLKRREFTSVA
jgi:hypothetical protein